MLRRPPAEPGETVPGVEAALDWLEARLGVKPRPAAERGVP
jgi:hypothetical protein